jgi:hypothetical protein
VVDGSGLGVWRRHLYFRVTFLPDKLRKSLENPPPLIVGEELGRKSAFLMRGRTILVYVYIQVSIQRRQENVSPPRGGQALYDSRVPHHRVKSLQRG